MKTTKITSGLYTVKITVTLLRANVEKEIQAVLTIEKRDGCDRMDSVNPWTWHLDCDAENFHVFDEDGGSPTKSDIVSRFSDPKAAIRNWSWEHTLNAWCI